MSRPSSTEPEIELWTIGHSTRSLTAFVDLLGRHDIEAVVDVRRSPASRSQPQFDTEALHSALAGAGMDYLWLPALGGRRRPTPEGPVSAWRNSGFQGYAEHVSSEEFAQGLHALVDVGAGMRTAMMCAEALWWRCHRRLIADVLVSLGLAVWHIGDRGVEAHRLAPPARLVRGRLSYAPMRAGRS